MAPYLESLLAASSPLITPDASLLSKLKETNEAEIAKFDVRLKEAEESMGETEISDILREKAAYITKIGDKVRTASSPLP